MGLFRSRIRAHTAALLVLAAGLASAPRSAHADLVEDPASKASFWAPDGWASSTQTRGAWKLFLKRAADEKAMCGLAVAKASGTLEWALESVEAIWKAGPERYERLSKDSALVAGAAGLRAEHRISIASEGRTLRASTVVVAAGEWRVALWAAHEAGLETAYAPIIRRIQESIVLPAAAAAPGASSVPTSPSTAGQPSSGTPQGAGLLFDPRFREGRPSDVLVSGNRPLLRGAVDAFLDLVEAATDTTLPEAEEQALRDGVEAGWTKAPSEDQALIDASVATRERMRAAATNGDVATLRAAVATFSEALAGRAAGRPAGAWQSVVRRASARKLEAFTATAAGEPVVSLAAIDSLEELLSFTASLARNDGARVTEGQRLAVRAEKLRLAIDAADPTHRRRFAAMRRFWALVKARWDAADADTRLRIRWSSTDLARAIAKLPETAPGAKAEGLPAYARAASEAAAVLPVFEAYTNVFVNLDAVVEGLVVAFGMPKSDVDAAFGTEPLTLR